MFDPGLGILALLPLELRQNIYAHFLRLPVDQTRCSSLNTKPLSLLATSHAVFAEAAPVLYSSNPSLISITPGKWDNLLGRRPFGYTWTIGLNTVTQNLYLPCPGTQVNKDLLKNMRNVHVHITTANVGDSARYVPAYSSWARRREGDEILEVVKEIVKLLEECTNIETLEVRLEKVMGRAVGSVVSVFEESKMRDVVRIREGEGEKTVWIDSREIWEAMFKGRK